MFSLAHVNVAAGAQSSDCGASFVVGERLVVVLADGAGGTSHGREAATALVELVAHELAHGVAFDDALRIAEVLSTIDLRLTRERRGQTTAVCVSVGPSSIVGASAGDSEAWLVEGRRITVLTAAQSRRPLLGAGARVTPFVLDRPLAGTLVLASDGLFSYASESRVLESCAAPSVELVATSLVDSARLPSGSLQDDLALFVARALR